ncbi:MAG: hypothetical protein Q4E13_05505 [Clostridia bacterium]|nr:hypothetical protein [Clostridia bacterium]
MKRIKYACLEQTIHFMLKEDLRHEDAVRGVQNDVQAYKMQLERSRTKHRIESEEVQPDGSIIIRIKKQYNSYDCGDYLD